MAAPQFSSDSSFPIPQKPFTSPTDVDTHRDIFAVYNSFRKLFGKLDGEFADVYDALSYKLGDAPMDGKQYARKDGNWEEVTGGGGGGGGALEFVTQVTLSAASTDMVISGLNFDQDELYQLELAHVPATVSGTATAVFMYYNTDFTATNYNVTYITGNPTVTTGTYNNAELMNLGNAVQPVYLTIKLGKLAGKSPKAFTSTPHLSFTTVPHSTQMRTHTWNGTANITTITLRHSVPSGFAAGTTVKIYRIKNSNSGSGGGGSGSGGAYEHVRTVKLTADANFIEFTGLNLTDIADYELDYKLLLGPAASDTQMDVTFNGVTTPSSYGRQTWVGQLGATQNLIQTAANPTIESDPAYAGLWFAITGKGRISQLTGKPGAVSLDHARHSSTIGTMYKHTVVQQDSAAAPITSFRWSTSVAKFLTGSTISLYKKKTTNESGGGSLPDYMDPRKGFYISENYVPNLGVNSTNGGSSWLYSEATVNYKFNGGYMQRNTLVDKLVANLHTGTNSLGGLRSFISSPCVRSGGGVITQEAVIMIPVASTASQRFGAQMGLYDLISGAHAELVLAYYTDNVNSGKWTLVVISAGVETQYFSSIPVVFGQAIKLTLVWDAAGTTVSLYVNDVIAVSAPYTLPIAAAPLAPAVQINKSVGTTDCVLWCYYHRIHKVYSTPIIS